MKRRLVILFLFVPSAAWTAGRGPEHPVPPSPSSHFDCLPPGRTGSEIVSAEFRGDPPHLVTVNVDETLNALHATCRNGKLVDSAGKEIRFYRPESFGAPTQYAIETTKRQAEELRALEKKYHVIGLTSSPDGRPRP